MTHLELRSWFLEPIPQQPNRWTKVRVWGIPTSNTTTKWWRSSSIQTRHSADHLQTRYGTQVRLRGPICKKYASALRMPDHAIRSFARGFPAKWKQLLVQSVHAPRRSGRLAATNHATDHGSREQPSAPSKRANSSRISANSTPRPSQSSSASKITTSGSRSSKSARKPEKFKSSPNHTKTVRRPPKPALKAATKSVKSSQPGQRVKKSSGKRVAFAEVKQSKPGVSRPPTVSTPAKIQPADNWSQSQKEAFESQRNTVPADNPDYWAQIAGGVEGKTADDCQKLWESSWPSPAAKKNDVGWAKPPKSPKVSTPEVVMHVRKAATRKRSRNTSKYRSGVRRLADTIARETSDDLLEPEIVTPKQSGVSLKDGVGKVPALGTDGTPGTEVRRKREKLNQDGEVATPEILARGKAFGLQEADKYVSLFKRRLGTCVAPSLKIAEDTSKRGNKEARPSKANLFQTTLLPLAGMDIDNDSQSSEESDLYF